MPVKQQNKRRRRCNDAKKRDMIRLKPVREKAQKEKINDPISVKNSFSIEIMPIIKRREKFLLRMIAFEKKHTFYAYGLILGGIVLSASQWFEIAPPIRFAAAIAVLGAVGLSLISVATQYGGLLAALLVPLAASLPIILIGGALYTAGMPLNNAGISLIIAILIFIGILCSGKRHLFLKRPVFPPLRLLFHEIVFFACIVFAFATLFFSRTESAVLGPWQTVRAPFFIFYFLSAFYLLWTWLKRREQLFLFHLVLFGILSTSVALIVFPLGFGFDPLIHEAAQSHIAHNGILEPKTFYYTGYYVLAIFLSKITALDLSLINRLIVPVGIMLSLIPLALAALKRLPVVLLFFAVPYPFLIVSTPWGFAYGITALAVLSSMLVRKEQSMHSSVPFLLGLAALLIHPLAGIPAMFYAALHALMPLFCRFTTQSRGVILTLYCIIGIIAIPAAFALNARISSQLAVTFSFPSLSLPTLFSFQTRFSSVLDPIYLYSQNLFAVLAIAALPGICVLWKQGHAQRRLALAGMLLFAITLAHAFILTHVINFPSLISYERDDYGMRLVWLAFLFLIPGLAETARMMYSRFLSLERPYLPILAGFVFSACLLTANLYLSYPRNDAFQAFHGYNASSADIEAVKWIRKDAGAKRFVMLANQITSATLIHEYGFGEGSFSYALPTSSPLYEIYRDVLRKPTMRQIEQIKKLYPGASIYIAISAYEPRFPLIVAEIKKIMPRWISFQDDAVMVFAIE